MIEIIAKKSEWDQNPLRNNKQNLIVYKNTEATQKHIHNFASLKKHEIMNTYCTTVLIKIELKKNYCTQQRFVRQKECKAIINFFYRHLILVGMFGENKASSATRTLQHKCNPSIFFSFRIHKSAT